MFVWTKDDLNPEQDFAVKQDNVFLIACPGSGKTRTLTYKIALELSKLQSEKEYIIAITFTNRAADEIKERIEVLGVNVSNLWIGTIHAFCLEWILRPYSLYSKNLKNGFRILNSHESEQLITSICRQYRGSNVTYWDCGFAAKSSGYILTSLDTGKHPTIIKVLQEYFKILLENNQVDFEQILDYSYKLIAKKPSISKVLSKLFPYILVDEFQDTKEIQYHIISSIIKAGSGRLKTFIVGDPNQSIYESLGGFPMERKELEALMNQNLNALSLSNNYRSSSKIIGYFDFFKTIDNQIIPSGTNKQYQSLVTFRADVLLSELLEEVVRLILLNIQQKKISPNEICIVAPQWIHLANLTRSLMIRLPDYSFDGPGMAPFSRDIENFWYKVTRVILTEPSPAIYIRRLRWSKEILQELGAAGNDISSQTPKSFLKLCNSINLTESNGLEYLKQCFSILCNALVINIETIPTLKEHYESFFASSKARIDRLVRDGGEFISTTASFKKVFKQREGITISSIHGVKGEEYDTVIGFALLEDLVPHFNDQNGQANAKKLLYVLSSRAKKNLHLLSEKQRNVNQYNPDGLTPTIQLLAHKYLYDNA
jgi:DNA helicase-2/ATP-dependent DNA helicase PcrA